jgi:glutamate racemase
LSDPRPIGVFDSGVGGLTVLREILRRSPSESTIYLGDNERAPYGTRSDDEVRSFSTESLDALVERDVKAIVVACNTSTAIALDDFRRRYELPILGVVRPGAVTAALTTRNRRVGVIATPATVRSHAYFKAIKDENPAIEVYETATASAVSELLAINGLEAPGTTRGTAADPGSRGHERLDEALAAPRHIQLTTGNVDAFRGVARNLFGDAFLDVEGIDLAKVTT